MNPLNATGGSPGPAALPPLSTGSTGAVVGQLAGLAASGGALLQTVQPVVGRALQQVQAGADRPWGSGLQAVLADVGNAAQFGKGLVEGIGAGVKALVGGTVDLAEGVAQAAYDASSAGFIVDGARQLGLIDHVSPLLPDAGRLAGKLEGAAEAVADYVGTVARDPAQLGNDAKGWIASSWHALEADHALAAAKGSGAEAEWWGQAIGRATFEVAALAVPATKFATVARAGEALELGLKAGKLGQTFAEAARAGKLAELFGAAAKAGKTAELVGEARTAGRLPELAQAARQARGGVAALAGPGGLTQAEIVQLQKLGVLSAAEGKLARVAEVSARRGGDIRSCAEQTGLPQSQIADILATLKPDRPVPESYLAETTITRDLAKFDEGAVRFLSRTDYNKFGTLGPPKGGFVMPYREFADLVKASGNNYAAIEGKLGLVPGTLADGDTMIVRIDRAELDGLRLPSGNEGGANEKWLPGGFTSGGLSEAVVDFSKATTGQEIRLR